MNQCRGGISLYQAPRGTTDILPEEQAYWLFVEQKAAETGLLYGYQRIDTPVFEDTHLFTRTTGEFTDIVQKEMYTFDDRGGNSLTLKPEGTAPICRAYLEHGMHNLPQPVKLYYFSPIFRYDRPQAGRYRQHFQFGCEAIGNGDPALDAELISVAWQFYAALGLKGLTLSLNSIGCPVCRPNYLKVLADYYAAYGDVLCEDCTTRLVNNPQRLLDCKKPNCQPIAQAAPGNAEHLCGDCEEHFEKVKKYLGLLDIPFKLNHRLVRGLDYYTRTVFEIQPEEEGGQSSLGGGGRYDGLIEQLGGKPTPGVGFGTGIERIVLNLKKQGVSVPAAEFPPVFIAHIGEKAAEEALKLASLLRQVGIGVIAATGQRSLKAQLRQANTLGARQAVIIGDDEVKTGTVILRDMGAASQESVPAEKLPDLLK